MMTILIILIPTILIMGILSVNDALTSDNGAGSDNIIPELSLSSRVAEMSERIRHAEMLNRERKNELMLLRHRLDLLEHGNSNGNTGSSMSGSGIVTHHHLVTDSIQVPSLLSFLPHLLNHHQNNDSNSGSLSTTADPLRPAFIRRSNTAPARTDTSIVIGIPTVIRPVESYLLSTITNLLDNMTPVEMNQTLIVVFIAETDLSLVKQTADEIEDQFSRYIESGLIEIISPPASYYPDMDQITATLGDSVERTRWRTKQNMDFAYLMMYCQPRGTYYVQLEDDILSKRSFVSKMMAFALKQSLTKEWLILDFCQLGECYCVSMRCIDKIDLIALSL
jgi:alpha-1,3-mannosylglycoprotein beta-1,4-N-acetylglucosaminyltransferase A/B